MVGLVRIGLREEAVALEDPEEEAEMDEQAHDRAGAPKEPYQAQ